LSRRSSEGATADSVWHFDTSAAVFGEAWDRNEASESLAGLVVGADRHLWRWFTFRGEAVLLRVWQRDEDAWLRGFTIGTRARGTQPGLRPLVDIAVGLSDATRPVPIRGTEFNYLAQIGAGAEIPMGRVLLIVTGRWFHISNSGREGRHLNPDIQAIGALVGVGWN
jgi:hypothetical protein